MRMSSLLSQTLREAPSDAEISSHQLLIRAGYIRQLAAGIFTSMPLAKRSLTKIENIMRDEMNKIGGQEMSMPVVHPAEIWKATGRWEKVGPEMGRFQDRNGRDMVLAMTHEEAVVAIVKDEVQSYRQLPMMIYHIQTKWRDDPRPRAGLIRVREFTMKDSYSLDRDWEGLDQQYANHYQAYFNIFGRCKLPVITVESDVGMMGGNMAHEYMYLTPVGEDTLLICNACGYSANRQVAEIQKIKAVKAVESGRFDPEIVPLNIKIESQDGIKEILFNRDEGPRGDTSLEVLGKLRPAFKLGGSVTAGNSSQMSDGSAGVIIMSLEKATSLGLKPLARFVGYAVAGVAPEIMGIGPIKAVPKVLNLTGFSLEDIQLIELNEAFAAQGIAVIRELGLNEEITNVNGGAIALGHPLGCTGAKLSVQMIYELKRRDLEYGLVTMCIGGGMGAAAIFQNLN